MGYNYRTPDWVDNFLKASTAKKLSTRDRKVNDAMKAAVILSPEDIAANLATELLPSTRKDLEAAIASEDDPEIRNILQNEHENLLALIEKHNASKQPQKPIDSPSLLDIIGDMLKNLWRPM